MSIITLAGSPNKVPNYSYLKINLCFKIGSQTASASKNKNKRGTIKNVTENIGFHTNEMFLLGKNFSIYFKIDSLLKVDIGFNIRVHTQRYL